MNTQKIKKFSEEYEKPKITEDDFRTLRAPVATFTILIFLLILFFFLLIANFRANAFHPHRFSCEFCVRLVSRFMNHDTLYSSSIIVGLNLFFFSKSQIFTVKNLVQELENLDENIKIPQYNHILEGI